ncbi:MAG TPA: hypothetical protein VIU12_16935 [Chryseolinea sp.]
MRRYNFSLFLAVLATVLNFPAFSQKKEKKPLWVNNLDWSEGTVLTNDGTELKGLLRYDDNTNILNFQDGTTTRAFNSRNVAGFEFTDAQTGKQRVFYTFPAVEMNTDIVRPLFFEFLRDFGSFTVLSRLDPLAIDNKVQAYATPYNFATPSSTMTGRTTNYNTQTIITQSETIYFMDSTGMIKPYLQITEKDISGSFSNRSKVKNKVLDEDVLEKFTAPLYDKVKACADKYQLRLDRKNDLLEILECYKRP